MKMQWNSLEDTRDFAQRLARAIQGQTITLTLDGDLGAGKTAFTRYLGQALGVKGTINSPTFTIMKSYRQENGEPFYHMDAYRLEGAHQDLGFEECFEEGICAVEWSEYIADQIPADHLAMTIEGAQEDSRTVEICGTGENSRRIVESLV